MPALLFAIKYRRQLAVAVACVLCVLSVLWVLAVIKERDALKQEKAVLEEKLKSAAALQEFSNQVSEAISQIKIRSSVNVSRIESEPKPVFVDSRPLSFIAGGVLQAVYSSAAAAGAAPRAAPGGSVPAGEPAGRVLSR